MRRLILIAVILAAFGVTLQTAGPAGALTGKSVSFTRSWTFKSAPLGVCLYITETGQFTYTTVDTGRNVVIWRNQRLHDPTLEVDVHNFGRGSCIGPSAVSRISMEQLWAGWSCDFNPALAVSLPWGVSLGGWPSCGHRNRAVHGTSYGAASFYVQHNTGARSGFGTYTGSAQSVPCYGVVVAFTAYQGPNISDSFNSAARGVCLPVALCTTHYAYLVRARATRPAS